MGSLLQGNTIVDGEISIGFGYEYEYLTDPLYGTRSIPNINRERTNNSTTSLFINYGLNERFGLFALFPYRSITNEKVLFRGQNPDQYEGGKYIRDTDGWGDIVLMVNYSVPKISFLPNLFVTAGVKLANGSIEASDIYKKRFSDNLQIGSGSVDPIFALNLSKTVWSFQISGSFFTRISSRENIYGYKYGNELHSSLIIEHSGSDLFYTGLSFSYLRTTRDYYQYGKVTRERGGDWIYAVPKVGVKLIDNLDFQVTVPVALYQNVNESQLTSLYHLQISTIYRITI